MSYMENGFQMFWNFFCSCHVRLHTAHSLQPAISFTALRLVLVLKRFTHLSLISAINALHCLKGKGLCDPEGGAIKRQVNDWLAFDDLNSIHTVAEFIKHVRQHHTKLTNRYSAKPGAGKLGILCRFILEVARPGLPNAVRRDLTIDHEGIKGSNSLHRAEFFKPSSGTMKFRNLTCVCDACMVGKAKGLGSDSATCKHTKYVGEVKLHQVVQKPRRVDKWTVEHRLAECAKLQKGDWIAWDNPHSNRSYSIGRLTENATVKVGAIAGFQKSKRLATRKKKVVAAHHEDFKEVVGGIAVCVHILRPYDIADGQSAWAETDLQWHVPARDVLATGFRMTKESRQLAEEDKQIGDSGIVFKTKTQVRKDILHRLAGKPPCQIKKPPEVKSLQIPQGVAPGDSFSITYEGIAFDVKCPKNAKAGDTIRVSLPAAKPSSRGCTAPKKRRSSSSSRANSSKRGKQ